jgi:DNA-directed RNA polymerase subunit RPC12/RpoP
MNQFTLLKCPSCGSSVIETENQNVAICSHCGSKLLYKNNKASSIIIKHSKILIGLFLLIASSIMGFYSSQQQNNQPPAENKSTLINDSHNEKVKINPAKTSVPKSVINLPSIPNKYEITSEDLLSESDLTEKPEVSIIHKAKGKTSNGGLYWIVTIHNNNNQTIYRPGAIVSLFDENGKHIEEQKGWSKHIQLDSDNQTELLLYISNPPKGKFTSQLVGTGSLSTFLSDTRKSIEIVDFIVKTKPNNPIHSDIIGDVKNFHDFQVDFVRVVAVAKDANNKSIGLADGFVSSSSLESQAQSGFKLRAGTFITEKPVTWTLFAFGQKHRDKL